MADPQVQSQRERYWCPCGHFIEDAEASALGFDGYCKEHGEEVLVWEEKARGPKRHWPGYVVGDLEEP